MIKTCTVGSSTIIHYYRPGELLDDISLKKLHNELIKVNKNSGANIVNKMIDDKLSLIEIRLYLKDALVAILFTENNSKAFLISPIISHDEKSIVHAGLIIVEKNPGANLVALLPMGNYLLAYKKMGNHYATNISSTPSIIESFSEFFPNGWPGPDVNLKSGPKKYKNVISSLKERYMDKYFPGADSIVIDYRRFVMKSKSTEMGFKTNFHEVSRAKKFKYNLFCQSWINYDNEEDIIQVSEMNFLLYLKFTFAYFWLSRSLKPSNNINRNSSDANISKIKNVA